MSISERLPGLKDKLYNFLKLKSNPDKKTEDDGNILARANAISLHPEAGDEILARATKCRRTHLE